MTRHAGRWAAYLFGLGLVAAACFGGTVDLGLDTHDEQMYRNNEAVAADWHHLFTSAAGKENPAGRPVAELVKVAGFLVWGNDSRAFHLFVVALHTLAAWLLARVARALGHSRSSAWTVGLLFLVGVSHFRAVYHISALDYPLAAGLGWAAVLWFLRYLSQPSLPRLIIVGIWLALAVMSHLSALALLPFCLYLAWERGAGRAVVVHLSILGALAMVLAVALVADTSRDTSTWRSLERYGESGGTAILLGCGRVLLWLLGRLLTTAHWLPFDFTRLHPRELGVGALFLALLGVLVGRRRGPSAAWAVWIVVGLLPFVLLTEKTILELPAGPSRYLYPSSAGVAALLALGAEAALRRVPRHRTMVTVALLAFTVGISMRSLYRAQALFFYTSGRSHMSLGQDEAAAVQFRRAIDRGSDCIPLLETYVRLANIQLARGNDITPLVAEARARLPHEPLLQVLAAIGQVELGGGVARRAVGHIDSLVAAQLRDGRSGPYDLRGMAGVFLGNRGRALLRARDDARAARVLEQALRYAPERQTAAQGLAYAWFRTGRYRDAGILWSRLGDTVRAATALRQALKANPEDEAVRALLQRLDP